MPQQWKRAEYGKGQKSRIESPRAEWYRVSEGFTHQNRVCFDGEIFHISELDMPGPNGENIESFRPLTLPEQERRFGRVMYMPYEPTDEELEALGFEREDVRADPTETQNQLDSQMEVDYKAQLASMDKAALQAHGREKWNTELVDSMTEQRMRAVLLKLERDKEGN